MTYLIRQLREAQGLTQIELAQRSNVGQGIISDIETGKTRNPTIKTLTAIAAALGVSLDALFNSGANKEAVK